MPSPPPPTHCPVAIIGAGPTGLALATQLAQNNIHPTILLDRAPHPGGIPRHCTHSPFGFRELRRCHTGPRYTQQLTARARAAGVRIHTNTTVTSASPGGHLTLSTPHGLHHLHAQRVALCTGARETPRPPRHIAGPRPQGILTTGALQALIHDHNMLPFTRPLIVGTELIALSALLTCRLARITPVAIIEPNTRPTAPLITALFPRLLRVPIHYNTQLTRISGTPQITAAHLTPSQTILCDGIILTGQFTPEATLLHLGHLKTDPATGGPQTDQYSRCTDPVYFAAGNLLRPIETAGWCWQEGIRTAHYIALSLTGRLPSPAPRIPITITAPAIRYTVPQVITPGPHLDIAPLQLRLNTPTRGRLTLSAGTRIIASKPLNSRPERRILLPLTALPPTAPPPSLRLHITPS